VIGQWRSQIRHCVPDRHQALQARGVRSVIHVLHRAEELVAVASPVNDPKGQIEPTFRRRGGEKREGGRGRNTRAGGHSMLADEESQNERLDHVGMVAGTCRARGMGKWGAHQAGERRNLGSLGTAPMALVLTGRGCRTRRLSLVPHWIARKPVEHREGEGTRAALVHDDGVGRTADGIAEHDPPPRDAGIARQAHQGCALGSSRVHAIPPPCWSIEPMRAHQKKRESFRLLAPRKSSARRVLRGSPVSLRHREVRSRDRTPEEPGTSR